MADKGPSALTAAATLDGTEIVHVVQSSNSRKTTTQDIADLVPSSLAISDVTGLQTALDNKIDDSQADAGGLAVLGAADATAVRAAAGVVIGTDVQAYDDDLTTYAGITPSANVQSVLGAVDYAAIKTLLGLVIGTDIPARSPSIQSVTSSATVTPTFADDQVNITAQAAGLTLANPSGTAIPAWGMVIRIKDNGTARTIAYGTQYRAIGVTLPTTTVISKTLYLAMIYNSTDTKWDVVSVAQEV